MCLLMLHDPLEVSNELCTGLLAERVTELTPDDFAKLAIHPTECAHPVEHMRPQTHVDSERQALPILTF